MTPTTPLATRAARLFALVIGCSALAFPALASLPALAAPAWWHITSGKSEVWIIGAPHEAPKGFTWDTRGVQQRLHGASALIIEPQAKGSLQMFGDMFGAYRALHSDAPLEQSLPAPLRQRFQAARASIGEGPGKYAGWKPTAAGVLLTNDFLHAQHLETGAAAQTVRSLARQAGVREVAAGSYEGVPVIDAAEHLSTTGQDTCLSASLHQIELGAAKVRQAAQEWARGVIRPNPTDPADAACLAAMPQLKSLNDRLVGEEAQAVVDALRRPGKTVAVFDLGATTMPGGVLDRLRARGLKISDPTP
ncbi:MAG TPA: TraB/GumN family protein [Caulobacteraceae bacterium]|nr:TraB/GumN family protein [Caulobacteraceae bacterium]